MVEPKLESLQDWIGREETLVDHVTVPTVERLAAMLDLDRAPARAGEPLPRGWYLVLFPRVVPQSRIGVDGHPERGDFLPPVQLPRRMFAGRRASFDGELRVGDVATKVARIKDITIKDGRSGTMVFVTVRSEIHSPRGLAIVEEQDIVYREAASAVRASAAQAAPAPAAAWSRVVTPDEVMLFRYSALCFNGHRIHYDAPYVTGVEGYPGLVVNGGLVTLLLYEHARMNAPAPIRTLTSRNVRALYVNRPITLGGVVNGSAATLWALDDTGMIALTAEATLG